MILSEDEPAHPRQKTHQKADDWCRFGEIIPLITTAVVNSGETEAVIRLAFGKSRVKERMNIKFLFPASRYSFLPN